MWICYFFFSSRRRHTRLQGDWSSDVCSSDLYLAEIATPGHKGFYVSWQSASQQVAVMFAALIGAALTLILPAPKMAEWGWRIPLLLGCAIVPLLFVLRRSLSDTDEFKARRHRPSVSEV